MNEQERPQALLSGIIYGEFAFWIAIIGMIVATIGIIIYFLGGNQFFDANILINELWAGKDTATIWKDAAPEKIEHVLHGHWYLKNLVYSDAISMLGIGICCLSAVVGSWGSVIGMIINKEKPYLFLFFAIIIAILLTCSAAGLISLH